jgi:glucosamine-6-phosphate deaminase
MNLTVVLTKDFDQMSAAAADVALSDIQSGLAANGRFTLGLATGASPTGLYKHLAKAANAGAFDPRLVRSFNLDEYVGLPGDNAQKRALHPESYSFFMIRELFGLVRRPFAETDVPYGCLIEQERLVRELAAHPGDWEEQGADKGKAIVIKRDAESEYLRWIRRKILDGYAERIAAAGGIGLHVIGVGGRGHVAFHESGIPFEGNGMLLVKLDANTVENAVTDGHFATAEESPRYAISMGAELVYQAKHVMMLASGSRKSEPVAASLLGGVDPAVPISYGQRLAEKEGGRVTYVLDEAAAAETLAHRTEIEAKGIRFLDLRGETGGKKVSELAFTRDPASGLMG